ncbi:hypothetical protein [Gordonibacter sp.]|uniref:hypothetical protein n=1 Tax=Gordonibacter sp. TaxID=1968902 RepID=UPI002FC8620F
MPRPCLDRFGGPAAWDAYCADKYACLESIKADDPGCGTCGHYEASEYNDKHGMCRCGLADSARRYRDGLAKHYPIPELVEAHGYVPCEYETYQLG